MAVTKKMYCVRDVKADFYYPPMFFLTKGEALRSFGEIANDKSHQIGKYPDDFGIFEVGTFSDGNCKFDIFDVPFCLGSAREFVKSE